MSRHHRGRSWWAYALPATAAVFWSQASAQTVQNPPPPEPAATDLLPSRPTASASASQRVTLVVPLIVNGKNLGDVTADVDANGQGTTDSGRLLAALDNLLAPAARTAFEQAIAGRANVPVDQLSQPGLVFHFDMASLELRADISRDNLQVEQVSVYGRAPPDLAHMRQPAQLAGIVNTVIDQVYTRNLGQTTRQPLKVGLDGFVTVGGFNGTSLRFGGVWSDKPNGPKWLRTQTHLSHDFFDSAIRINAGEFNLPVTGFQRGGAALGFSISRDYDSIRPFENVHPSGRSALTLDRESTVIVMVNGIETRRLRLEPGRYQFSDFGAPYGSSQVKLIVEDSYGRREVSSLSLFNSTNLLARGVTDFAISAAQRPGYTQGSYDGPVIASGYWRRGISDSFTLGGGAQLGGANWLSSGELSIGTRPGIAGLTFALSRYKGRTGTAAAFDFRHERDANAQKSFVATLSAEAVTANFASPYENSAGVVDERWRIDSRLEWRGPVRTLAIGLHAQEFRRSPSERRLELTATNTYRNLSSAMTLGVERGPRGGYGGYVLFSLNVRLGVLTSANMRYDTRYPHGRSVDISHFSDQHVGDISGRLQIDQDAQHSGVSGNIDYYGNRFLAHAEDNIAYADPVNGGDTRVSDLRVSTALTFADGAWSVGRPSSRGFIMFAPHSSLNGSQIVVRDEANRIQARSGLLPAVTPIDGAYSERTYSFDVDKAPDGYNFGDTTAHIFPAAATGYRIRIGSAYWKMAMGYLLNHGAPVTEQTATVRSLTDKQFRPTTIFTNSTGRFVADGLAPGSYEIVFNNISVAHFTIPNDRKGLINVGKIDISGQGSPAGLTTGPEARH